MADKISYKLIAFFVAILVYFFVLYALVFAIFQDEKKKKDYGFNVEDAIVVNIDTLLKDKPIPIQKPKPKNISMPVRAMPAKQPVAESKPMDQKVPLPVKPVVEEEKKVEKEPIEEIKKESRDKEAKSAKDLFSTVRTDKYKEAIKEHHKQELARASRLKKQKAEKARKKAEREQKKKAEQKRKQRAAQKMLEELQISQSSSKHLKKGQEDEFWSFVSNKIMSKWQRTISTQNGLHATVLIRIDNNGRLSYRNLKSSYNSLFDTKLKVFLDNLEYERFPSYKKGSYIEAEFEFKDKEKGL